MPLPIWGGGNITTDSTGIKNIKKIYLEKVKIPFTEDYLGDKELNVVKELLPNCEIIA